ncbi:MAG: lasso peptide biosynthesis B2 protein [Candidatus Acidiferrales bacterium]
MRTWRRFRSLTGTERRIVLEAAAALAATWLAMRVGGFNMCKAAALARPGFVAGVESNDGSAIENAQRIARLEAATARNLFFRANCLEQSLALCWMLRRRRMNAELRIGARKEANRLEAHAWVELSGSALGDASEEHLHFVPFEKLRTSSSMEAQTH